MKTMQKARPQKRTGRQTLKDGDATGASTPAAPAEQNQPASAKAATSRGGRIVSLMM